MHPPSTEIRHTLVEKLVEVEVIAGQEAHGGGIEGKLLGLSLGHGQWVDVDVEWAVDHGPLLVSACA